MINNIAPGFYDQRVPEDFCFEIQLGVIIKNGQSFPVIISVRLYAITFGKIVQFNLG